MVGSQQGGAACGVPEGVLPADVVVEAVQHGSAELLGSPGGSAGVWWHEGARLEIGCHSGRFNEFGLTCHGLSNIQRFWCYGVRANGGMPHTNKTTRRGTYMVAWVATFSHDLTVLMGQLHVHGLQSLPDFS